jgi:protein gp37
MSFQSTIEWTQATWNPVTGCTKVSPGCKHCYAETFAERFRGVPGHPFEQGFDLKLWPERLQLPLSWREPRVIFVNSMSDLFHKDVPDSFILQVFDAMAQASWHKFQLLTKRSQRFADWTSRHYFASNARPVKGKKVWPKNVWAGVSIETQEYVERSEDLLRVPADIRFLSIEPLLGPVKLKRSVLKKLHWVIVGGESGHHARPMQPEWARDVRDQCLAVPVPFFFKQWGVHDAEGRRKTKKAAGRILDGRLWDQMPQLVQA